MASPIALIAAQLPFPNHVDYPTNHKRQAQADMVRAARNLPRIALFDWFCQDKRQMRMSISK